MRCSALATLSTVTWTRWCRRRGRPTPAPTPDDAGVLALALRLLLDHADRRVEEVSMSERVLLHVGTPKTGTSYLQDVLFRNRRAARATPASPTPPTGSTRTSSPPST